MRRNFLVIFFIIIILSGSTLIVFADEQSDFQTTFKSFNNYYDFNYSINPSVRYNPVEKWRLGGAINVEGILGQDCLNVFGEYSFSYERFDYGLLYLYKYDNYYCYANLYDNINYHGIYGNDSYWQQDHYVSIGVTREDHGADGFCLTDVMVEYLQAKPANQPTGYVFDTGSDLAIYPSIFGSYKGYTGKVEGVYSHKTEFSDYQYFKVNAMVKKGISITPNDTIVLGVEGGFLEGTYPRQQQFFLGSSTYNLFPNFKDKLIGLFGSSTTSYYDNPAIYLDGYEDNAFSGSKMYAFKIEYQRDLIKVNDLSDNSTVALTGKIYGVMADAWNGDLRDGFIEPKSTIGVGLLLQMNPGYDSYLGLNLARGLNEKAATTFGIELGAEFHWLNFLMN